MSIVTSITKYYSQYLHLHSLYSIFQNVLYRKSTIINKIL